MTRPGTSVRFLASVRNVAEAVIAAQHGADIIDCKEPENGALGALSAETVAEIRRVVPPELPVSATIGDDAAEAADLVMRIETMAATGVNFVKIGFDGAAPLAAALNTINAKHFGDCQLVGVLLADRTPDFAHIDTLAKAGFAGVLLDTAEKQAGALPDVMAERDLEKFVSLGRAAGLFVGLAGALRAGHVDDLRRFHPDIMGFRGALCENGGRSRALDAKAVQTICRLLKRTKNDHAKHALNSEGIPT